MMQNQKRSPPFDSNAFAVWALVTVGLACVLGVTVNTLEGPQWILPGALFVVIIVGLLVMPGGWLRRESYGGMRLTRWLGSIGVALYPVACWAVIKIFPEHFLDAFVPIALFTIIMILLGWQIFLNQQGIIEVGLGIVSILYGVSMTLEGVEWIRLEEPFRGFAMVLFSIAVIIFGVSLLQAGDTMIWISSIIAGVSLIFHGVNWFQEGNTFIAITTAISAVAVILMGLGSHQGKSTLFGSAVILGGISGVIGGVAMTMGGIVVIMHGGVMIVSGIAMILGGSVMFLVGDLTRKREFILSGSIIVLAGLAFILGGAGFLQLGATFRGAALILLGGIVAVGGIQFLIPSETNEERMRLWKRKVWQFLSARHGVSENETDNKSL